MSRRYVPVSEHLRLAVAAAHWRGYVPPADSPSLTEVLRDWSPGEPPTEAMREYLARDIPTPLDPGEPVPGCGCPECTGLPEDHPARQRRRPRGVRPAVDVDRARAVPVTEVARRVGLELDARRPDYARCSFHDDSHPSLHLNNRKGRAFCNPCGQSWDGIALLMAVRKLSFAEAVRELAA